MLDKIKFAALFFVLGLLTYNICDRLYEEQIIHLDIKAPSDRVNQSQIKVYDDKVIINISGVEWAEYEDTGSMIPILGKGHNGFEIIPKNYTEINVGDIVIYKSHYVTDGLIVHRVIKIGYDSNGWFAILKGDNNEIEDPGLIRFEQIKGILIGVLY